MLGATTTAEEHTMTEHEPGRPQVGDAADQELRRVLAQWPALADPDDEPCEVWHPGLGGDHTDRSAWTWHPGTIRERIGPDEWLIDVGVDFTQPCFRDHTEIRRPAPPTEADQPLTAGELRAALAGVADDTPVRVVVEDENAADFWVVTAVAPAARLVSNDGRGGPNHTGRAYVQLDGREETQQEARALD